MQKISIYIFLVFSFFSFSQNDQLALNYFEKGEFEKALSLFEQLTQKQPSNYYYFEKVIDCYQQLEQYEKAEKAIDERKKRYFQPMLHVELGYNYQLQKNQSKADKNYQNAIDELVENANYGYQIASVFEKKSLLDWALKTYETAQKLKPTLNFDFQIALLQGQLGNVDIMIDKFLTYSFANKQNVVAVQSYFSRFLQDDASGTFSDNLKKALIKKTQIEQDVFWNQYLSWFFVNNKEFNKAFIQEKAIYKRNPENFNTIVSLATLALEEKQYETSQEILNFVIQNTTDDRLLISANTYLLKIKLIDLKAEENIAVQTQFKQLIEKYRITSNSLELVKLYAHFEAFTLKNTVEAKEILNKALELPLNIREKSEIKMELADIMIYDEKFNQAILFYAQVEDNMKNDPLAYEATMKMAKANFYKGDFDWALQQVKELKQSTSLLIANDAVELYLLIQDNIMEDSTHVALTAFSKADLKLYQNKEAEALQLFLTILEKHKGDTIEDETLYKIAQLYTKNKEYTKALSYYKELLDNHSDGIYSDEAYYFSAQIYNDFLNQPEKAKEYYEKIVLNHPDSIYFPDARLKYRTLRGDSNL